MNTDESQVYSNASQASALDLMSIRLKKNVWTGARYESDYWVEARPVGGNLYDVYSCTAKWEHSKRTNRSGNTFQGQSDERILEKINFDSVQEVIEAFNFRAYRLEEEHKADINPDKTKSYSTYYPRNIAFIRAMTGRWDTKATESPIVSFGNAPQSKKIVIPLLSR